MRLLKIVIVSLRFRLDALVLTHPKTERLYDLVNTLLFQRGLSVPRAVRLRKALETLGPIFVKFGQLLSTRRDLLPTDIADELAKLQDQVPPYSSELAIAEIERSFKKPIHQIFKTFDARAIASASIAQVHFAVLHDGKEVAVKVLRPKMEKIIAKDLALLDMGALLIEKLWEDGPRLKPREVVAEFAKHLRDELDLMREAANASQLRRNFANSVLLLVPEIYWDYCSSRVMTMQRMSGTPISHVADLRAQGVDIPALARAGVEIFFTQVFRDAFFHADMHPGNILVSPQGKYIALDFGIMGTLNERDKNYLAQNFLAFFRRDYKRVAIAHVESGWAPKNTRIDEFEVAIRSVCEPIFDRPLKEISFGKVLLRLFQTSRRFNIEIQPQLVLLQKTLLNIEGLGRELDPNLDLWKTAKPYLERWMSEQIGWRAFLRKMREEMPYWGTVIPQLPRFIQQITNHEREEKIEQQLKKLVMEQKSQNRLMLLAIVVMVVIAVILVRYI